MSFLNTIIKLFSMSAYEGELMDMDEMDDAESGYFQEVRNYDDATDHSSGSFQGSVIVPTFNSESVNLQGNGIPKAIDHSAFRAEFSTLALQGSQGFQTLDQSTEGQGRQGFQTLDQSTEGQGRQGFQTLDQSTEGPGRQGFQTLDQSTEGQGRHAHANYDVLDLQSTEGQGRHSWHAPESHGEQIVYTLTGEQVRALSALSVRESDIQLNLGKSEHTDTTHQENAAVDCKQSEPVGMSSSVNRQDLPGNQVDLPVYTMDTSSNVSFQSSDVEQTVNRTDVDTKPINIVSTGTEGSSHENRSPKRRQKKNKSSASQGSEVLS